MSLKVDFSIGGERQAGKFLLQEGIEVKDLNFSTENGPWNKPPEFSLDHSWLVHTISPSAFSLSLWNPVFRDSSSHFSRCHPGLYNTGLQCSFALCVSVSHVTHLLSSLFPSHFPKLLIKLIKTFFIFFVPNLLKNNNKKRSQLLEKNAHGVFAKLFSITSGVKAVTVLI